jgi:toxin ParE1/3/4
VKPVVFHAEAEAELEAGVAYYESQRSGLGLDFQAEVESKTWLVRGDPQRWPTYRGTGLRRCLLDRFPYSLFYLDLEDEIWVAAVAHQKRKPGYWAHRQPGS